VQKHLKRCLNTCKIQLKYTYFTTIVLLLLMLFSGLLFSCETFRYTDKLEHLDPDQVGVQNLSLLPFTSSCNK
jgi:hypothetical protein